MYPNVTTRSPSSKGSRPIESDPARHSQWHSQVWASWIWVGSIWGGGNFSLISLKPTSRNRRRRDSKKVSAFMAHSRPTHALEMERRHMQRTSVQSSRARSTMPMWSLPLKNIVHFRDLIAAAQETSALIAAAQTIAAAQVHRSRSNAPQPLKKKTKKHEKKRKTTKNTQMVVNVKEFANAGSVKRRAPAHCGKSFHVTAVAQKKRFFFEKTKTRLRGKKTKKK